MKQVIKNNILGWLLSVIIAIAIVFILKTFIGMPTTVKGTSMATTLFPEEKLFISTWSANFDKVPEREDIITFEAPSVDFVKNANLDNPVAIYTANSKNFLEKVLYYTFGISKNSYIKRVIGLPGDHIEIKHGKVYINEKEYNEEYISEALKTDMALGGEFDDIIVPEGHVYVLGDNRIASVDSRRFGCIPISKIQGKVLVRWWPMKKIGTV